LKSSSWLCVFAVVLSATAACSSNGSASSTKATESVGDVPSSSASATPPGSVRPTLTDPKVQPPSQQGNQYSEGLPDVVFDPCTWISDQTIQKAGFDPASRHRVTDTVAEQTFFTCGFSSVPQTLRLISGNVPWDQDVQKVASRSQAITVNGRQAMRVQDPNFPNTCEIDLRTKVGFVQVFSDPTDQASVIDAPSCNGLLSTATLIEPEIGKGN